MEVTWIETFSFFMEFLHFASSLPPSTGKSTGWGKIARHTTVGMTPMLHIPSGLIGETMAYWGRLAAVFIIAGGKVEGRAAGR